MGLSVFGGSVVLWDGRTAHRGLNPLLQVASYFPEFKFVHSLNLLTFTWCQTLVRCRVDDRDESDRFLP